ncbi:MAG: aminotransferase class V-fold PLP-dependent enzyme [Limisphaerales bacterium]
MTLDEVLSNEELRQHEFPVTCRQAYLAHAAASPLPRRVSEAVQAAARESMVDAQDSIASGSILTETRSLAARLLGATAEEIALVGSTSVGLSLVVGGLSLRRNSNVLIYFDDAPSNVHPWLTLAARGVEVRLLNVRELGRIRSIDVLGQIDEDTRMVALSSCHFVAGWRLELAAIGRTLRKRGILFCVDGIQTVGAFPTPVEFVDILAAGAHQWLLGPAGAGFLYVRRDVQERLAPAVYGWHNVVGSGFVAEATTRFRSDAQRYEAGTANWLGNAGLRAALELILEVGVEAIAVELLRKRALLIPELEARGCVVLQSQAPEANRSGIVSFHRPGTDLSALYQQLTAAGVVTSLRADRSGRQYLRVSPHFYNTDAELMRVIDVLR